MRYPKIFWQHFLKQKTVLIIMTFVMAFSSKGQFVLNSSSNNQTISPNPLNSTFDYGPNTATTTLQNSYNAYPLPYTKVLSSTAFAFSTTNQSSQNKVYWTTNLYDGSAPMNGSFTISTDKYVAYVDLAIVSDINTTVMYVVTQEVLSNLQYTYLRSYLWSGTDYIYQNTELLYPPGNGGGDYTISIDNNNAGNFIICWQRNMAASGSPNSTNIFAKPGKFSSSFPYYTLGVNTLNITQLSGTNPAAAFDSHVYPDVSINDNNKVVFVYEEYPNNVKLFSTEGNMNYNNFQFTNLVTQQLASYSSLWLIYRPKISYWKNNNSYGVGTITYNGNDYAVAYSVNSGSTSSNYDLVSICCNNGTITSPRLLNSLSGLNTIHSQFWDHDIVPVYNYSSISSSYVPAYEIITEFKDVNAYIYGTTASKIISRTTMLDNSPSPNEHNVANAYPAANYLVLTSADMANNDVRVTSAATSKSIPYQFFFTSVKTGYPIAGPPAEIIHGSISAPCVLYCRPTNFIESITHFASNSFAKSQSITDDKNSFSKTSNELFYPNPAGNFVKLNLANSKFALSKSVNTISILNMEGKTVKKIQLQPGLSYIDLSGVNSGMYIIQISNSTNSYSQKLIITKSN